VDFFAFNKAYVDRLRNGDPATELHFFVYFERLLRIKLRARALAPDKAEDLKQDTFIRVIAALRKEGGVRQPERFGAFVNSVCNNVSLEYYRSLGQNQQLNDTHEEIPDKVLDLEGMMVSKQCSERVRKILWELPARDRELLGAVFLEEKEKDTVCREMGVDRNYLRVLLHRAKHKFKAVYEKEQFGALPRVTGFGNSRNDLRPSGPAQRALGSWPKASQFSRDSSVSALEGVHGGLQENSRGTT
jgi:RNA polymerase sigma-70 factor (ECF subfamily)